MVCRNPIEAEKDAAARQAMLASRTMALRFFSLRQNLALVALLVLWKKQRRRPSADDFSGAATSGLPAVGADESKMKYFPFAGFGRKKATVFRLCGGEVGKCPAEKKRLAKRSRRADCSPS